MKKGIVAALVSIASAASALAQGYVIFENQLGNGSVYLGSFSGPYAAVGTYTVALLWAPGTTAVPQASLTQIATYMPQASNPSDGPGYFFDRSYAYTGSATSNGLPAIFEVQGWTGNYSSYSAAVAAGAWVGQTAEFLNNTGNLNPPASPPSPLNGWDGNLIIVPEPGTLALAALGATTLLFACRRKRLNPGSGK